MDAVHELREVARPLLDGMGRLIVHRPQPTEMDGWLAEWSELEKKYQSLWVGSVLAYTRDSEDKQAREMHSYLMKEINPGYEALSHKLAIIALRTGFQHSQLGFTERFFKSKTLARRDESAQLLAQEAALVREYERLLAELRVQLDEPVQSQRATALLESIPSRVERERIWRAKASADGSLLNHLDTLFLELIGVRHGIARNSGFATYRDYAWATQNRIYQIEDAIGLLDSIRHVFKDVYDFVDQDRIARLGLDKLRPWDARARLDGTVSAIQLSEGEYLAVARHAFGQIAPQYRGIVSDLAAKGRLDLSPRSGKSGGNLAAVSYAAQQITVLCNLPGNITGLRPLFHELGHATHFHHLLGSNTLFWELETELERAELFAFIFQTLCGFTLASLTHPSITNDDRLWYGKYMVDDIVNRLRDVDERVRFEMWVYSQSPESLRVEDLDNHYLDLHDRPGVDWSGLEKVQKKQWQKRHTFLYTFYNIEYAIGLMGMLLFIDLHSRDPDEALSRLDRVMRLGASTNLKGVFAELGIGFPFSQAQLIIARDTLLRHFDIPTGQGGSK